MKTMILLCGLMMLAACGANSAPPASPGQTQPRSPSCDNGGPCGPNEQPR